MRKRVEFSRFDTPRSELCGLGGLVNEESKIDVPWANAPQPHVALSKYFTRLPAGSDGDRFLLKDEYVSRVTCGDIDYLLRNQLLVRRGPNWRSLVVVDPNAVLPSHEGSRH